MEDSMALWAGLQEIVNLLDGAQSISQGKIPDIVSWIARFNKWAWHWTYNAWGEQRSIMSAARPRWIPLMLAAPSKHSPTIFAGSRRNLDQVTKNTSFGCLRGVESNEYFSDDALSHVAQTDGHLNLTDVGRLVDTYRVVLTWSAFATSSNIISIMISRISFWISSDVHCIWWSSWLCNAFVNQGISLVRRWRIRAFKRWKRTNWSRFLPENLD